jgi:hypothetical protein
VTPEPPRRQRPAVIQETPEGSVFELTPGKAPEGASPGLSDLPPLTTPEGWICIKNIAPAEHENK